MSPSRPAAAARGSDSSGGASASGGGARSRAKRLAVRTYAEFVWSLSFGLVTVASSPLIVVAMLALGAFKSASDGVRTATASWAH
ncbi:MAG: hypothetical protein J3K34DRAFT_472441 [Monoraphidium minutum]|nr:MAG: hypothetical protein J3K34DRAFT_472441 [Monoraphidium minutum]